RRFKGLVTSMGTAALAAVRDYSPAAVTLDLHLPDIDGWRVLERHKNDLATRQIPVFVVSTEAEEARSRAVAFGACGFIGKPLQSREALEGILDAVRAMVKQPVRRLLAVGSDGAGSEKLLAALDGIEADIVPAVGAREALEQLRRGWPDCLALRTDAAD